ncbi:hypothetical protein Cch01nite_43970 [Cellulomonas chitinilytica]|uniref:Asp23/Gls24 family envelope stress response protein n=1 Tax=Cellulomonas chitinilytica TaxID=398759 RepID=A0A919P5M0_9CELL|nr:hypothetical protein [Cellulomonas chitinilytica]GIG23673.1 hypothetical protein Cch01nite_43970 [Cellulomonas chitinilytica]
MNGEQILDQATRTLREHTDAGWVALRDDVVAAAVRAFRASAPVRGRLPDGELWVASAVLVAHVRTALSSIDHAGALRITCTTTPDDQLDRVTVEIVALYGTPLVPLAGRVRAVAAQAVAESLGLTTPPVDRVVVDVSVGDVTADPRRL